MASDYWEKRQSKTMQSIYNAQERRTVATLRLYKDTREDLLTMLADLHAKYEIDGKLSYTELQKFDRWKKLQKEIDKKIVKLGKEEVKNITHDLKDNYRKAFEKVDDMFTKSSVEAVVVKVNEKAVEKAITYPWSGDMFSNRLWDNKDLLAKKVKQTITQGVVQGKSITDMTRGLRNDMGKGAYECRRLVRTETAHVVNSATIDRYKAAGIDKVEWITAEDERVCDECGPMHGNIYSADNVPDIVHPNCRCTFKPIIE